MSTPREVSLLERREELRRLIDYDQKLRSVPAINDELVRKGIIVTNTTIARDLKAIGAVKNDAGHYELRSFLNVTEGDERLDMDEISILNEVDVKLRAHVLSSIILGNEVILRTEPAAGPLVSEWMALLPYRELVHVSEERSASILKCRTHADAVILHSKIAGTPLEVIEFEAPPEPPEKPVSVYEMLTTDKEARKARDERRNEKRRKRGW